MPNTCSTSSGTPSTYSVIVWVPWSYTAVSWCQLPTAGAWRPSSYRMFARTPHESDWQRESYGATNVHHVPFPSGVPAGLPASDCGPSVVVWIPSEKLEPSGPGSLTAVPDSPDNP